jgi:hypothetical protein
MMLACSERSLSSRATAPLPPPAAADAEAAAAADDDDDNGDAAAIGDGGEPEPADIPAGEEPPAEASLSLSLSRPRVAARAWVDTQCVLAVRYVMSRPEEASPLRSLVARDELSSPPFLLLITQLPRDGLGADEDAIEHPRAWSRGRTWS